MLMPLHPLHLADAATSRRRADEVIAWLRDYSEARIDSRLFDERRCVPPFVILDFGNRGLMGLQVPESFGGLALRHHDFLRVLEQLAAIDVSLASLIFIHNANGVRPIMGFGKPALRERLLPIIASGRELSAFALTEPAAGSNLPGLETRAEPDGKGGWRLYGVKRWNGSGWAGIVTVFARVADAQGRLRHPTAFVVRQGDTGIVVGPESLTMGVRSIMQNAIIFDGAEVGAEELLGEPGQGMEIADEALLIARLAMGAISLGVMKRCAQLLGRYASRRRVSTGLLRDTPTMRIVVGELTAKITALQVLVDRLSAILDTGHYPAEEACMIVKIFGSHAAWEAADALVEGLGGRGYMENNGASQIMRDCRMLRIGEGANDLMTLSVGRRVIHSQRLHLLLREVLAAPHLDDLLRLSAEQTIQRCLSAGAPFADRGTAVAWANMLTGRLAIASVVLAALEAEERERSGPAAIACARRWATDQFETALRHAVEGDPRERLATAPDRTSDPISGYSQAIGDLEQSPPGIEGAIDPLLRRDPQRNGFAAFHTLPGAANGDTKEVGPSARTQKRVAAIQTGDWRVDEAGGPPPPCRRAFRGAGEEV